MTDIKATPAVKTAEPPADTNSGAPSLFVTCAAFSLAAALASDPVVDPYNPMGARKYGLSKLDHPRVDFTTLTAEEAVELHRIASWHHLRCDDLPASIAAVAFDIAVNQGVGVAALILQSAMVAVGIVVEREGDISDKTVKALAKAKAKIADIPLEMMAVALKRQAFTSGASTHMAEWSKHMILLSKFIDGLNQ